MGALPGETEVQWLVGVPLVLAPPVWVASAVIGQVASRLERRGVINEVALIESEGKTENYKEEIK